MIGNSFIAIDVSTTGLWKAFSDFIKGKRKTKEIQKFVYNLERELSLLSRDIVEKKYKHLPYTHFEVSDNKRRRVSVASVRDRVIHRLLYNYLVSIYDKTFFYDVWSCRKGKGLLGAIERAQLFLVKHPRSWVWRMDITKFFDSVDRDILKKVVIKKVFDTNALYLIEKVIASYSLNEVQRERGMPIGNLTSQIFANIYLHEFDRYIVEHIKPLNWLRYGDDCIMFFEYKDQADKAKEKGAHFLKEILYLNVHTKNNIVVPARKGLYFLGCYLFPKGRRLNGRMRSRISEKLTLRNASSYQALVSHHEKRKKKRELIWYISNLI